MDRAMAVKQLIALLQVGGALKIITTEVRPDLREDPRNAKSAVRQEALAANPNLLRSLNSFVAHDVVAIEGPNEQGIMTARSAEGDWCTGMPEGLLLRLLRHQGALVPKLEGQGNATMHSTDIVVNPSFRGRVGKWLGG